MALIATPLSYNWTTKEVIDTTRASAKEEDEQIATDDNIRGFLQWAIHTMFKAFPAMRHEYLVDVPFVVDTGADPLVSTLVRPRNSATAKPVKIISSVNDTTKPVQLASGLYDCHYAHPVNFIILGWWDVWNELTGTCRRSSDYSNLMGHSLNNNTQLARSIAWHDAGRQLWISVREGMFMADSHDDVIVHGVGWRTPLKLINLVEATPTVPTGADDFAGNDTMPPAPMDESKRYLPVINDWERIDIPDDYVGLAIQLAGIKLWGAITKASKETEGQQIEMAMSQFLENSESAMMNRETNKRATQYLDRSSA